MTIMKKKLIVKSLMGRNEKTHKTKVKKHLILRHKLTVKKKDMKYRKWERRVKVCKISKLRNIKFAACAILCVLEKIIL